MGSTECKEMISKYEIANSQIIQLYKYIANCKKIVNECIPLMEKTIVDSESMDKGKLENCLLILEKLEEILDTIVAECKFKKDTYEIRYVMMLNSEKDNFDDSVKIDY